MKKIIYILILLFSLFLISLTIILSTIGIETKKFNNFISKKIGQFNNNINIELTTVMFRLDFKQISLFLETKNPQIKYRSVNISTKKIKVYLDFLSILKSGPKINKINLNLNQIDINQFKEISSILKPSNFTSFVTNKIKQGKLDIDLDFYFKNNNLLDNFIARGSVSNLKAEIINDLNLNNTNFNFFGDQSDILIKNIFSEAGPIKIIDGDLKVKLLPEISLESNFKTNLKIDDKNLKFKNLMKKINYFENIKNLEANINNTFFINFDKTYKVKKYDYRSRGKIVRANINLKNSMKNLIFSPEKINQLSLFNSDVQISLNSLRNTTNISGKYSLNKGNILPFNFENISKKDISKIKINAEYAKHIELELINFQKPKNIIAKINMNLDKTKDKIKIKKINFTEGKNSIFFEGIIFDKNKFISLKKISVKTNKDKKINNDFTVFFGKKILIKGKKFDATNLPKILNKQTAKNFFSKISKNIEIDFTNIIAPMSENLKNFKLIGKIEKGKFVKISSKGEFGNNNFLDIKLKKDNKSKKKYLEIYSDLTKPLLSEYSFFNGLSGGKLLYTSIIKENSSNSKLKIENFKVINAPGVVKLLSLADLGGLADLAEGEGLTFDVLEINMNKTNNSLKLNEILALGPSISVLMEGYQNSLLTSLRGTLIPAKTLNKMISKIPVLGDIIIPKEIGEGLFGISFKMKGPPGKIKTTINPIRTLTPRFIQKIIDKRKYFK